MSASVAPTVTTARVFSSTKIWVGKPLAAPSISGASFTAVMVMATAPLLLWPCASVARTVKVSAPLKLSPPR